MGGVAADPRQQGNHLSLASKHQHLEPPRTYNLIPTLVATDRNKMIRLKDVQGRIYRFKSESECLKSGILTPVIQDIVRCHMVLVLDVVPAKKDYVKIMTVSA
jgi:hypothetical protein